MVLLNKHASPDWAGNMAVYDQLKVGFAQAGMAGGWQRACTSGRNRSSSMIKNQSARPITKLVAGNLSGQQPW